MGKFILILPIIIITITAVLVLKLKNPIKQNMPIAETSNTPTLSPMQSEIAASFEIYTNGTKRIFTETKYHNQSNEIYITAANPSIVYVKSPGITWSDFFATLPMKLEKDCLTTGTGQVFCTNNTNTLKFFINDIENTDALDENINNGDRLKVVY